MEDNMIFQKFYFYKKYSNFFSYSKDKKEKIKLKKLKDIVSHSYEKVPFYRKYWSEKGFKPSQIHDLDDISKIPKIKRRHIEDHYEDFFSLEHGQHKKDSLNIEDTAGTLSNPLKIPWGEYSTDYKDIVYFRTLKTLNYSPLDKILYYWPKEQRNSFYNSLGLFKKELVDPNTPLKLQLKKILKTKPKYLIYFPSAIYFISNLIINKNIGFNYSPKAIFTQGEVLTSRIKEIIENAFKTKVIDLYATREAGILAAKYNDKYIVNSDFVLLELNNRNKKNGVLLTSLVKEDFPVIRYEIGDVISGDGVESPIINDFDKILGRKRHLLSLNDFDEDLHSLINKVSGIKGIYKFGFVFGNDSITLEVDSFWAEEKIEKKLKTKFNLDIDVRFKENMKPLESGKFPLFQVS